MTPKQILKKEPFKRIMPYNYPAGYTSGNEKTEVDLPQNNYAIISQEKFLSELSPSGHVVNLREDKITKDKDGNIKGRKSVAKIAVAMQEVISTKQKVHLTGNPVEFTLTESKRTDEKERDFVTLKQGWIDKNMHVALTEAVDSWLTTGDAAIYTYRNEGKFGTKVFSFKKGDVLLPHYDYYGNLVSFGRFYASIDDKGRSVSMMDVFDKTSVATFQKRGFLGFNVNERWVAVGEPKLHGFNEVPIVYKRSDDVCWGSVQPLIDSLEEALSNMSENNRYYSNMILFIKGNVSKLSDRDRAGKVLQGDDQSDAKFLATSESNSAQMNEIETLMKQIFLGSFTVSVAPDTVQSSGDLPGITVKLLFSPATEKAMDSAKLWDEPIDKLLRLFKIGYGLEIGKVTEMKNLKCRAAIKIYTPENEAEAAQMINEGVFSGAISVKTANEKYPKAVEGEHERVVEQKENESRLEAASSVYFSAEE